MASGKTTVGVLGAGSWGVALALVIARAGYGVQLVTSQAEVRESILHTRRHPRVVEAGSLPLSIVPVAPNALELENLKGVVLAVPAEAAVARWEEERERLPTSIPCLVASKGLVLDREQRPVCLTEYFRRDDPLRLYGALSGPNLAGEIMRGLPSATVIAAYGQSEAEAWCRWFDADHFRPYASTDPIAVQLGGALKNVIAIASGMASALGVGENAGAALVTRGLAELRRLTIAMGGHEVTCMGLSGVGDMMVTCHSAQSRNHRYGVALVASMRGDRLALQALERTTVEGLRMVRMVPRLVQATRVMLPMAESVHGVVTGTMTPLEAMDRWMERPLGWE
jgi:glycerol-3-phosphate dehydrogenase (NAD(P)+)